MYDEYGFPEEFSQIIEPDALDAKTTASDEGSGAGQDDLPHTPIRAQFPEAGSNYLGGRCDGWEYRTVFGGAKLAHSFEMVRQFLREEGYADVPLPASADELRLFRRPRPGQQQLFGERGYVHNPVKILFSSDPKLRNALILCVYNEKSPGHLLRFHGLAGRDEA